MATEAPQAPADKGGEDIERTISMLESDIKMIFFSIARLAAGLLQGTQPDRYMLSLHAIKQLIDRALDYEFKIKTLQKQLKQSVNNPSRSNP